MSLKATVRHLKNRAEDARLSATDRDRFVGEWCRDVAEVHAVVPSSLLQVLDDDSVPFSIEPIAVLDEELGSDEIGRMTMT